MIWRGLVGVAVGFLAHFALYDLTRRYTHPADMYRYGSGVLIALPVFALFRQKDKEGSGILSFLAAFVFVGLGVILARLSRKMYDEATGERED